MVQTPAASINTAGRWLPSGRVIERRGCVNYAWMGVAEGFEGLKLFEGRLTFSCFFRVAFGFF